MEGWSAIFAGVEKNLWPCTRPQKSLLTQQSTNHIIYTGKPIIWNPHLLKHVCGIPVCNQLLRHINNLLISICIIKCFLKKRKSARNSHMKRDIAKCVNA